MHKNCLKNKKIYSNLVQKRGLAAFKTIEFYFTCLYTEKF